MTKELSRAEREELELLLPWYANGTLDADQAARIEAALAGDEQLRRAFSVVAEDRQAVIAAAEAETVPESIQARFLAQLDSEPVPGAPTRAARPAGQGLLGRVGAWLAEAVAGPAPARLGMVAAAAVVVIALQAALIGTMLVGGGGSQTTFTTASGEGPKADAEGPAFLVRFVDTAELGSVSAFLAGEGARLVDGPGDGGLYTVRFAADDGRSRDDLAAVLRDQAALFQLVLPRG